MLFSLKFVKMIEDHGDVLMHLNLSSSEGAKILHSQSIVFCDCGISLLHYKGLLSI